MLDSNTEFGPHARDFSDTAITRLMRAQGIRAVLWKGRSVGLISPEINSDIDLLVHKDDKAGAENALKNQGFTYIPNSHWRSQACVDDWYAVDRTNLAHVQLYDQLVLGSYASTQILVPNSDWLFDESSEYTSDNVAAVLRICRATLYSPFHPGKKPAIFIEEARQLADSVASVEKVAANLFDDATASLIAQAFTTADIRELKSHLIEHFQAATPAGGAGLKAHILKYASNINRRTLALPVLPRRSLKKPAPIIALIGSDGSGKSTAAVQSVAQINKKIDVKFIYFGTGDGSSSLLRLPLLYLKRLREIYKNKKTTADPKKPETSDVPSVAKAAWAISVAMERRSKMKRAKRYAANGFVVITDRYPQNEIAGIHDGPRLSGWLSSNDLAANGLKYKLAKWEQGIYAWLSTQKPDLVILLDVDLQTAIMRRPEETPNELEKRIKIARKLTYCDANKSLLSASDPLEVVLGNTMNQVMGATKGEV